MIKIAVLNRVTTKSSKEMHYGKSRNRNNQGKGHPNDNEQITDAEILDNDEQVEEQLIEEELDQMANEELEQVETKSEDNQSTEAIQLYY